MRGENGLQETNGDPARDAEEPFVGVNDITLLYAPHQPNAKGRELGIRRGWSVTEWRRDARRYVPVADDAVAIAARWMVTDGRQPGWEATWLDGPNAGLPASHEAAAECGLVVSPLPVP